MTLHAGNPPVISGFPAQNGKSCWKYLHMMKSSWNWINLKRNRFIQTLTPKELSVSIYKKQRVLQYCAIHPIQGYHKSSIIWVWCLEFLRTLKFGQLPAKFQNNMDILKAGLRILQDHTIRLLIKYWNRLFVKPPSWETSDPNRALALCHVQSKN